MSLLYRVVFAAKAASTHHKIALDALRLLTGPDAEGWRTLFLANHRPYLEGAKAPDDSFKDFTNHVLHVDPDGARPEWGGAVAAAQDWFARTIEALSERRWHDAAFTAGVMSHYLSDPFQPLHTAQSEAEGAVHRPAEWSFNKAYGAFQHILEVERGGYPALPPIRDADDLAKTMRAGARLARTHYEAVIDHYDLAKGATDPLGGLDQELRDRIAGQVGLAVSAVARALEGAIAAAGVRAPAVNATVHTVLAGLEVPVRVVLAKIEDAQERAAVAAIAAEVAATGRARETLSEDDRIVRLAHATEVLKITEAELDARPSAPIGTRHGRGAPLRTAETTPRTAPTVATRRQADWPDVAQVASAAVDVQSPTRAPQPTAPVDLGPPSPAPIETAPVDAAPPEPAAVLPPPPAPERSAERASESAPEPEPDAVQATRARPAAKRAASARPTPEAPPAPMPAPPSEQAPPTVAPPPTGPKLGRLSEASPVVEAPSIGPKTAERLGEIGVVTVGDLLALDPSDAARRLDAKFVTADVVAAWQAQARLVRDTPGLSGSHAQLLVACGVEDAGALAAADPAELARRLAAFADTAEGRRIVRSGKPPDAAKVSGWIAALSDADRAAA